MEEAATQNVDTLTQEQAELDSEIEHEAGSPSPSQNTYIHTYILPTYVHTYIHTYIAGVDALVGEPSPPTSSASSAVDLTYHTV